MSGKGGKSQKKKPNGPNQGGRGNSQPPLQPFSPPATSFVAAPAPAVSVWGNPARPSVQTSTVLTRNVGDSRGPAPAPVSTPPAWGVGRTVAATSQGPPAGPVTSQAPSVSAWGPKPSTRAPATPSTSGPDLNAWRGPGQTSQQQQRSGGENYGGNGGGRNERDNGGGRFKGSDGGGRNYGGNNGGGRVERSDGGGRNYGGNNGGGRVVRSDGGGRNDGGNNGGGRVERSDGGGRNDRGNGGGRSDRGAIREKHVISDIIKTRSSNLQTKQGSKGVSVPLITNYYRLLKKPEWQIYQYRVDFAPDIENDRFKKLLIKQQKVNLGGYLFEGTMLFLTVKLPDNVTTFMTKDRDESPIQISIKFIEIVSMLTAQSIQILNLIMRKCMKSLDLQLVGRNFFDAIAMIDLPQHRLQLWPGYVTSIRQHEQDILMCVEITHKVMRSGTVLDILEKAYRDDRYNYKAKFESEVIGMTVLTNYNNKNYRVDDVDWDTTPNNTFSTKNGDITFIEYYTKKYNLTIHDKGQPMLIHRSSDRELRSGQADNIALVPELCRPTGLNDAMRSDWKLMAAVAEYTRLRPDKRMAKLQAFNNRLQGTAASVENLKEWNFRLDKNLVEVKGHVLPSETIYFGLNHTIITNPKADWSNEFRKMAMYNCQHLTNWVIIIPQSKAREVDTFLSLFRTAGNGMKYKMSEPIKISIKDDHVRNYAPALDEAAQYNPQLIMCIVTSQAADRYSVIKKKCCVERAIPTQVIVSRTITPKHGKDPSSLLTVATKVLIQINSKLGGAPWMVGIPWEGMMIVGFDVYHDTKNKNQSFGAMVATMDQRHKQNYFSTVSPHESGVEMSNEFALNISKALIAYRNQHNYLPTRILIYRDGVGEGQINHVIQHEVKEIKKRLFEIYGGDNYHLGFVVVTKRINTRFFKGSDNPSPGTVVDDVVTMPERYDFNLVSQFVNQGTVSPTNYNIIEHETVGMTPDQLQIFTYKMTHLYYNWTGTLRVPAVCQYAHKLAFLVGSYIHQAPSSLLEKQLYFL